MGTKTPKHTAGRKSRAAKTTERPASDLERAQAILATKPGRVPISVQNPFFCETSSDDTVTYVSRGLALFSQLSLADSGVAMNKDLEFGQFLILQTMRVALDASLEQMKREHEECWARATVAAHEAKGGAK